METKGKLYMIPQTLGDTSSLDHLSPRIQQIISELQHFIFENEKSGRKFIKKICPHKKQNELIVKTLNKFTTPSEINKMLLVCSTGASVGMISDAGCPGIADPGAILVENAYKIGIQVIPLVGPSSLLLALMASGMNGQSFAFHGYLPIEKSQRKAAIRKLQRESYEKNQTQLFIETPYRNNEMLTSLIQNLDATTKLCVACDLNLESEYIKTQTVKEWGKKLPDLHKRPCVFLFEKKNIS